MTFFLMHGLTTNLYYITEGWLPETGDYMHRDGKLHRLPCRDDFPDEYDIKNENFYPGYWFSKEEAIACWKKYYGDDQFNNVLIEGEKVQILA